MIDKKKCAVSLAEQILKDEGVEYLLFADEVGIFSKFNADNPTIQDWLLIYIATGCVKNNVSTAELVASIRHYMEQAKELEAEGKLK